MSARKISILSLLFVALPILIALPIFFIAITQSQSPVPLQIATVSESTDPGGSISSSTNLDEIRLEHTPEATAVPDPSEASLAYPAAAPVPVKVTTFESYTVRRGDMLALIAARYDVSLGDLMAWNGIKNADLLYVGQALRIRVTRTVFQNPSPPLDGPGQKLIPDSELVYGPAYANFDVNTFASGLGGYLVDYRENVEGTILTGPQIVQLIAERFSVGPRVLLTILEMQGGWVTRRPNTTIAAVYPMGYANPTRAGLYRQLFWVADQLNQGYYLKYQGGLSYITMSDGSQARVAPSINPGTASLQTLFAHESTLSEWQARLGPNGFLATYQKLFGDPMSYSLDPVIPPNLAQPALRLPWEDGHVWYMTGGPHGGWGEGSGWDAVDFAPTLNAGTCFPSPEWAVAAAPGRVTEAEHGRVMLNLSNSKFQGDGWTLLYMHMATYQRIAVGTVVQAGDHIGHPSCEGGLSQADHLHFARLYNGQWFAAADNQAPLNLDGWVLQDASREYDGLMVRGTEYREACNCHTLTLNGLLAESTPQASALVGRVEADTLKPAQNGNSTSLSSATNSHALPSSVANPASNSTGGGAVGSSNSNGSASNPNPSANDNHSRDIP